MLNQGAKRIGVLVACLLLGVVAASPGWVADSTHGKRLSDAMGFAQAFEDGVALCVARWPLFVEDMTTKRSTLPHATCKLTLPFLYKVHSHSLPL
jgi:hypothetical protein